MRSFQTAHARSWSLSTSTELGSIGTQVGSVEEAIIIDIEN